MAFIFSELRMVFPQAGWSCCFCGGYNPIDGSCNANNVTACSGVYTPGLPPFFFFYYIKKKDLHLILLEAEYYLLFHTLSKLYLLL